MRHLRNIAGIVAAMLVSTAVTGQMTLDLDPAPGDQGKREAEAGPGQTLIVELIALGGANGMIGFKAEVKFDKSQLNFKGFNAGGLMAGAMSMPPKEDPSSIEINAAIMGGGGATSDAGSIGQLMFEAGPNFTGTPIELVSASFGSTAGIQDVGATNAMLKVYNPDSPPPMSDPAGMPPGGAPAGFQNQPPPGGAPAGFQNQPPPGGAPTGFQNQPPPGGAPAGFQNQPPPGGAPAGFQNQPPPGGPTGFQNPGQPGGPMGGPMGGPGMPHEEMDPEDAIQKLPEALQASFRQTLDVERESEREHLNAELKMLRSVRETLEKTKQFMQTASPEDQQNVAHVLMFFHHMEDRHGPGGPGGPHGGPHGGGPGGPHGGGPGAMQPPGGMGSPGMPGGPGMGMPDDPNQMVARMIQEVEAEIQHLEQELQNL